MKFLGSTGTLILDNSTQFTGQLLNLTGNGSLSGSDKIDLKDVGFGSGTTVGYSGNTSAGTLTVSDAQHHTANIALSGDYTHSTFSLSSDGNGGTIVIDPPDTQVGPLVTGDAHAGIQTAAPDLTGGASWLDSQLSNLVQAMAAYPTGKDGLESFVANDAHLLSPAPMIGAASH